MIEGIQLEILLGSYLEHFKKAKDLALVFPVNHPQRLKVESEVNAISDRIKSLKHDC